MTIDQATRDSLHEYLDMVLDSAEELLIETPTQIRVDEAASEEAGHVIRHLGPLRLWCLAYTVKEVESDG
jgi:hypothetical protein